MRHYRWLSAALFAAIVAGAHAIVLGQRDDFQGGTLQSWEGGADPLLISTDGPAGTGDAFMQITSAAGGGMGGKLAVLNVDQWTGDYAAAGVRSVDVHMRNQSNVPVDMRIVLFGPSGSRFTSTRAIRLAPGSGWTWCTFPIGPNDLVRVLGGETYDQIIVSVSRLMFRHDSDPASFGGDDIEAQLGIDNIVANPWQSAIPATFEVRRGFQTGGTLSSLWFSDDRKLSIQQRIPFLAADPSTQLIAGTVSPLATPSALTFRAEWSSNFVPAGNGIQRIELFNFAQNRWDVIDQRSPSSSDVAISVRIASGASDYVEQGTRRMQARLGLFDRGAAFPNWSTNIDEVVWFLEP